VGQPQDEVHRHLSLEGCLPCYSEGRVRQVDHRGHKEPLDDYTDKISSMAVRYARLGTTLDDTTMVKKLLDTVPDQLYPAVAGIEQFYDVKTMPFQEVLCRLRGRSTSVPSGAVKPVGNGVMISSCSQRPSGRFSRSRSRRSGNV
jgi:hypothetical protein